MAKKQWKSIHFDLDKKTYTIMGEEGKTYDYRKLKKCSVACEDAKQKGNTKPFLHSVLVGTLQYSAMHPGNVYVGLILEMTDLTKAYVYISDAPVQINALQFHKDMEEANGIKQFCDKIIEKYRKEKEAHK